METCPLNNKKNNKNNKTNDNKKNKSNEHTSNNKNKTEHNDHNKNNNKEKNNKNNNHAMEHECCQCVPEHLIKASSSKKENPGNLKTTDKEFRNYEYLLPPVTWIMKPPKHNIPENKKKTGTWALQICS